LLININLSYETITDISYFN